MAFLNKIFSLMFMFLLFTNGDIEITGFNNSRWIHIDKGLRERKYYFYHGEKVKLECRNLNPGSEYDILAWQFNNDTLQRHPLLKVQKSIILDSIYHLQSLSCICKPCQEETYIRTQLLWDPTLSNNPDTITIDGFETDRWKLDGTTTIDKEYKIIENYKYSFYHGEILTLVCKRLNTNAFGQLGWGEGVNTSLFNKSMLEISYQLQPTHHGTQISCTYQMRRHRFMIRTRILWNSSDSRNIDVPYLNVDGFDRLRLDKINENNLIYYFQRDEIINITCINKNNTPGHARWNYKDNNLEIWDVDENRRWMKIQLNIQHDNIYIECSYVLKSYENGIDYIGAGNIKIWFQVCKPTLRECDPVKAISDSQYGCRPKFYITGLPPALGLRWNKEDPDGKHCSTVLPYTQTPYNLNLSCSFITRDAVARTGYQKLTLSIKGGVSQESAINKDNCEVNAAFSINREDDGKKIVCAVVKTSQKVESTITITLKYVAPPIATTTTSTKTKIRRLKRYAKTFSEKKAGLNEDVIQIYLSFKNNVFSCELESKSVTLTEGNPASAKILSSKDIDEFLCSSNNYTINLLERVNHTSLDSARNINMSFTATKSMAGSWNCTILAAKNKGIMLPFLRPQYERDGYTYLYTNCFFSIHVLDRPTPPPTTTGTTPATTISSSTSIITTPLPTTTKSTKSTKSPDKNKNVKRINADNKPSNKSERNKSVVLKTKTLKKPKPNSIKKTDKSGKGSSSDKKSKVTNTTAKVSTIKSSLPLKQPSPSIKSFPSNSFKEATTTITPLTTSTAAVITEHLAIESAAEAVSGTPANTRGIMNYIYYGIAAAAVFVVLIIVIIVCYRTCKQAKQEEMFERSDFTYENLQDENSGQFPPNLENAYSLPYDTLTRQRDDCSEVSPYAVANYKTSAPSEIYNVPYVDKDLSKLYSKPLPKSQRNKQTNELMYSKIIPKSMRKRKQDSPYAEIQPKVNEIAYAEIEATESNRYKLKLKPIEPTYSEVMTAQANVNKTNDYKNVVPQNSRYANAKDTEYAEPAYCELGKDDKKMIKRRK